MSEQALNQSEYEVRARCEASLNSIFALRERGILVPDLAGDILFQAAFTMLIIELHELLQRMDKRGSRYTHPVSIPHIRQFKDVTDLVAEFRNGVAHTHSAQREIPLKSLPGYQEGRRRAAERTGDEQARPWARLDWTVLGPTHPDAIFEIAGFRMPQIPEGDFGVHFGGLTILMGGDIYRAHGAAYGWFGTEWSTGDRR